MSTTMPEESRGESTRIRKGARIRIKVIFPMVVMLAVVVTGFSMFLITRVSLPGAAAAELQLTSWSIVRIFIFLFILSLFGLVIGLSLANYVTAPLQQLKSRAEEAATIWLHQSDAITEQPPGSRSGSTSASSVFGELGHELDKMVGSLGSYVLDSYILDSITGGIMTVNQEGIITSFTPQAEHILGFRESEIKGAQFEGLFPEISTNLRFRELILSSLKGGETHSSQEVTVLSGEQKEVLIGVTVSPLRDDKGDPLGVVLSFKDLAAVKQVERQIQRAEQLATLGTFAAGMAHEIRNPLASLQGLVEMLQEDLSEDDPRHFYFDTINRNLTRLTSLTESLLGLAHPGETHLDRTDINEVVQEAIQLARHKDIQKEVEMTGEYGSGLPYILADSEKLSRAFLNLFINALEATPEGGKVSVITGAADESPLEDVPGSVMVAVANTGSYIPPEELQRLFRPFYTTREQGVGLGLAITQQIIQAHSGRITVESEPANGTCFRVFLPMESKQEQGES